MVLKYFILQFRYVTPQVLVPAENGADSAALKNVGLTLCLMTSMAVFMMNM